jgi:prepilin-type N-terminal cleavage/methylation domain-containing protein
MPMRGTRIGGWGEQGWTLLELIVVVAILGVVSALAITPTVGAMRALRVGTDRRALVTTVALARMRAAAGFTRARVYAELDGRRFRLQVWRKTGGGAWVTEGGDVFLSTSVNFGFGAMAEAPANTQAALGQAPACRVGLNAAGAAIANTACIVFNSRSIPIDAAGAPSGEGAFWVNNGVEVHGATVSATGLAQSWSAPLLGANPTWTKR